MPSPQKLGPTTVYATGWSATKHSRLAQVLHRAQEVVTPEAEAKRSGRGSTNDSTRSDEPVHVGHQDRTLDAHLVHLVEQLVELPALEHRVVLAWK